MRAGNIIFIFLSNVYKGRPSSCFQSQLNLPSNDILCMYCTCKSVRALKEKPMKLHTFLLTMIPLIPHIFSLTTIIVFSLAYSDGSDAKAGDVAQPLVERPRADTPDGLGNYALGLDPTGEADDWKKIADTSNDRTGQVVVIVAEPNNHGCSNTNKRRREIGRSCSFDQALSEFRPSSAQEKKPKSQGQFRNTRQRKKEATPEGSATPVSSQDLNCPSDSWAVCGANELIQNYLNPGNFREVPWLLDNIPPIIELQRFCRYCESAGLLDLLYIYLLTNPIGQGFPKTNVIQQMEESFRCVVNVLSCV